MTDDFAHRLELAMCQVAHEVGLESAYPHPSGPTSGPAPAAPDYRVLLGVGQRFSADAGPAGAARKRRSRNRDTP
jgi:hypothetical protein